METTFKNLLFHTAFCCMTSDGHIDDSEIAQIKSLCAESPLFEDFDFQSELNTLIKKINEEGIKFQQTYFDLLKNTDLSEENELTLLEFAVKTVLADENVDYSEIKFVKKIRHCLKVSDEKILETHPDFEQFLEDDIMLGSFSEMNFDFVELPQFSELIVEDSTNK